VWIEQATKCSAPTPLPRRRPAIGGGARLEREWEEPLRGRSRRQADLGAPRAAAPRVISQRTRLPSHHGPNLVDVWQAGHGTPRDRTQLAAHLIEESIVTGRSGEKGPAHSHCAGKAAALDEIDWPWAAPSAAANPGTDEDTSRAGARPRPLPRQCDRRSSIGGAHHGDNGHARSAAGAVRAPASSLGNPMLRAGRRRAEGELLDDRTLRGVAPSTIPIACSMTYHCREH